MPHTTPKLKNYKFDVPSKGKVISLGSPFGTRNAGTPWAEVNNRHNRRARASRARRGLIEP